MMYSFAISGHPNIRATHRTTIEFTKDSELSLQGDCIVGVNATFELDKIKPLLTAKMVKVTIKSSNHEDSFTAVPNPHFNDEKEMVFRITDFLSERTIGTRASKSASQLSRELVKELLTAKKAAVFVTTQ